MRYVELAFAQMQLVFVFIFGFALGMGKLVVVANHGRRVCCLLGGHEADLMELELHEVNVKTSEHLENQMLISHNIHLTLYYSPFSNASASSKD